jgi:hypothetical protein
VSSTRLNRVPFSVVGVRSGRFGKKGEKVADRAQPENAGSLSHRVTGTPDGRRVWKA